MTAVADSVRPVDTDATPGPAGRDTALLLMLAAVAVAGMVLRAVNVLDAPIRTDEPTITLRAVAAAQGQLVPDGFGYPPFAAYLLAIVLRLVALVEPGVLSEPDLTYAVSRLTFVALSGIGIFLTAVLAVRVSGQGPQTAGAAGAAQARDAVRSRWLVGVGTAIAMAVSFHSVRLGNHARPDQVQLIAIVLALLATCRWDRQRSRRWLVAAGVAAGLAAATKYNGGAVVLVTAGAVLLPPTPGPDASSTPGWATRFRDLTVLGLVSLLAFVVGSAGTVLTRAEEFWAGFAAEFQHQAGQHLGYEPDGNAVVFHLTQSLPGNWGWPLTLACLGGVGWIAWRGSRGQRVVAGFAVLGVLFAVTSQVRFPHYVLLPLPGLAIAAFIAIDRVRRFNSLLGTAAVGLVALSLLVTTSDDARMLRALGADHTQDLAGPLEQPYADELVIEAYTARGADRARTLFSLTDDPDITRCGCVVALSSFQEGRFRNRPDLYARQIALYDEIRRVGQPLGQVGPGRPLAYNWNLLPQWGVRDIPLSGPVGAVGPEITVLRMPNPTQDP